MGSSFLAFVAFSDGKPVSTFPENALEGVAHFRVGVRDKDIDQALRVLKRKMQRESLVAARKNLRRGDLAGVISRLFEPCVPTRLRELIRVAVGTSPEPASFKRLVHSTLKIPVPDLEKVIAPEDAASMHPVFQEHTKDLARDLFIRWAVNHLGSL